MKKFNIIIVLFIFSISSIYAEYTMEVKGGLSLSDKYEIGSETFNGSLTYNLAVETMYATTDTTEVGLGISFKANSSTKGTLYDTDPNGSMHLFDSIPIYGIAKYTLPEINGFIPYVRAYLGLSFNRIGNYKYAESISSGLHTGIGFGGTYGNVVTDLSYVITQGDLKFWYNNNGTYLSETRAVTLTSLTLTVGYKFELTFLK
jgi:hypothetical protein